MCILADLYYDWHLPQEGRRADEEKAWGHIEDLWEQAEMQLDAELLEELQESVSNLIGMEAYHEFEAGFRLGAQLMLELKLPTAPDAALLAQQ